MMKFLGNVFWFLWIMGVAFTCLGKAANAWQASGAMGSTYPFMWSFLVNWIVWGFIPFIAWKLINRK